MQYMNLKVKILLFYAIIIYILLSSFFSVILTAKEAIIFQSGEEKGKTGK